jgi:hypothetical protein
MVTGRLHLVGGYFVERMTDVEVQSIENVLRSPIEGIREHFTTALQLLSDRESLDYRRSIKESISKLWNSAVRGR